MSEDNIAMMPTAYTVKQVAQMTGFSPATIRKWVSNADGKHADWASAVVLIGGRKRLNANVIHGVCGVPRKEGF